VTLALLLFLVTPEVIRPGEPVTVLVSPSLPGGPAKAALYWGGKRRQAAPLFQTAGENGKPVLAAILALSSLAPAGEARVTIEDANGAALAEAALRVEGRDFPGEELAMSAQTTAVRANPNPRREAEAAALSRLLATFGGEVYSAGPFRPPLAAGTFRTGPYGSRYVYVYSDGRRETLPGHAGIDFRAAVGTPVAACARGRVALAAERVSTGWSVVLEHLPGVYSLYYHLSGLAVSEGQVVEAGEVIGQSGATGVVTGPHLHWEIRAAGENADPDAFVSRPLLDPAALAKIGGG